MVTPLKDVAVDGDGAVEDGDGVGNFGGGGGGFNRTCCCVLIAQILGWRAIPSRAKLGDLSSAKSEKASRAEAERQSRARKSERSHAVQPSPAGAVEPSREAKPSRAGLPDRESFVAFPIQLGPKAAAPNIGEGGGAVGHLGEIGGGVGRALGAGDGAP
jgi:hypothetical protein